LVLITIVLSILTSILSLLILDSFLMYIVLVLVLKIIVPKVDPFCPNIYTLVRSILILLFVRTNTNIGKPRLLIAS
jgi:hypothetical protein